VSDLSISVQGPTYDEVREDLVAKEIASEIGAHNPTLWGPDAVSEAEKRLGWVDLPESSRPLLAEIDALAAELRSEGIDHVVLCGMGGSSLAPEVITRSAGVELTVLDTTDPQAVARALSDRIATTVIVVSSKSGGTVETDSQRRAFIRAFTDAGVDPASRIVVVTDPGSSLAELAEKEGYRRLFLADPTVGGRFSALSAFGLVPSGLAGADIATLLDDAAALAPLLETNSPDNPALVLGAIIGGAHEAGRDKLVIAEHDSGLHSFGAWAEQLIAESTGKLGRGVLPVDDGSVQAMGWPDAGDDATRVAIGSPIDGAPDHVAVSGPLGAQFLLWEWAVAVAGVIIKINPFDQPNVEEAKEAARGLLDAPPSDSGDTVEASALTDEAIAVYGDDVLLGGERSLQEALDRFLAAVPDRGYVAVLAYLDPEGDAEVYRVREALARRLGRQVTFGWGPRFLHSTGQYHKGGHPNGAFLEITGAVIEDLEVPERPYTFGRLIAAQAAGDLAVLRAKNYPTLRLHLLDRAAGVKQLLAAVNGGT
jgi:glucose-6-phosphate isomerase